MMFGTRVNSSALGRRLDAGFYNPEYIAAEDAISRFPLRTMESLRADGAPIGYGVIKPRFQDSSIRMVRIQDFSDPFVDLESGASIDPQQMTEFKRSACQTGDLLVAIGGYPGRLGLIPSLPSGVSAVNINQHIVRVRFASGVDAYYVTAFLMSATGAKILARQVSGSVQAGINVEDFRLVNVPYIGADAQRYIGDKVHQAERLRERARRLERESSSFFELPEWTEPRAGHRRSYVAGRRTMESERLDAPFYDPGHAALEAVLRGRRAIHLSQAAALVDERWNHVGQAFNYFEIGDLDIASGILSASRLPVAAAPSRAQILVEPWDVLVSTVRPNRKNIGLVPASDEPLALVASTGFAALRFGTPERAVFYHSFLRSDAATQQLMRWNSGATYPAIESDVPLRVLAPDFDDDVIREKGSRWLHKFLALDASRQLTTASTLLVEQLIDGRIIEADLVAAQKALETGDRTGDRAIFQALRQDGASDGQPLIPDLDGLYALLDEPDAERIG